MRRRISRFHSNTRVHDGSAADLRAVVEHYDRLFALGLNQRQKADLVEFLKSI